MPGDILLEDKLPTTSQAMKQPFGRMLRSRMAMETGTHSPGVSRRPRMSALWPVNSWKDLTCELPLFVGLPSVLNLRREGLQPGNPGVGTVLTDR
jgi:hypothetical protein